LWPLGLVAIALPLLWRNDLFNGPWLRWVGLVTRSYAELRAAIDAASARLQPG